MGAVLRAEDCDELIHWLRHQRLFYRDGDYCMLHAGLPPQWDLATTEQMARETEQAMQGGDYERFFRSMYGNKPLLWRDDLPKNENCALRSTALPGYVIARSPASWISARKAPRARSPRICCRGSRFRAGKAAICGSFSATGRQAITGLQLLFDRYRLPVGRPIDRVAPGRYAATLQHRLPPGAGSAGFLSASWSGCCGLLWRNPRFNPL